VDTITQLVTIAAVVLGALTTYVTNHLMERSRRRLALQTRWDEKKLDAYAEFIGRVRTSIYVAVLAYEVRTEIRTVARPQHELLDELTDAWGAQALAFERVMLLAGDTVIEAAHGVQEAAASIAWQARGLVDGTLPDWRGRNTAAFQAINRFHECARADLGVSGRFEGDRHSARGLLLPETRAQQPADGSA
jgi:hypothetical protein